MILAALKAESLVIRDFITARHQRNIKCACKLAIDQLIGVAISTSLAYVQRIDLTNPTEFVRTHDITLQMIIVIKVIVSCTLPALLAVEMILNDLAISYCGWLTNFCY